MFGQIAGLLASTALSKVMDKDSTEMEPDDVNNPQTSVPLMDNISSFGKDAIGSFASQAVNKGVSSLTDKWFKPSARSLGQQSKEYMDSALPGTTPWERLGSSSSGVGGTQGASATAKVMRTIEREKMENQKEIARIQAEPQNRMANVAEKKFPNENVLTDSKDTETRENTEYIKDKRHWLNEISAVELQAKKIGLDKIAQEIKLIKANIDVKGSEDILQKARANLADLLAKGEVWQKFGAAGLLSAGALKVLFGPLWTKIATKLGIKETAKTVGKAGTKSAPHKLDPKTYNATKEFYKSKPYKKPARKTDKFSNIPSEFRRLGKENYLRYMSRMKRNGHNLDDKKVWRKLNNYFLKQMKKKSK